MATVKMLWGPGSTVELTRYSGATFTQALEDADNAVACVYCLPKDGTITHVGFYVDSITGTPPAYYVGLTTIDGNGNPTQTDYGGSTKTTAGSWTTGWKWIALATSATAVAGDFAAVHVYPTGTAPSTSNRIYAAAGAVAGPGYYNRYTTAWSPSTGGGGVFAIKYDDGTVYGNALSTDTISAGITSATTPDEIGCKFTLPANMTCFGIHTASGTPGTSAAFDFILYDESNTALATCSVSDKDYVDIYNTIDVYFDAVSLTAGSTYRAVVKPTVGTNGAFYPQRYQFESTAAKAAWPCGDTWQYTYRTDAGSWTDVSTDLMYIGLWVSDIDFSGGTVTTIFEGGPLSAEFPSSNFPALTPVNGRVALAFDASTDEACYWSFICPQGGIGTTLSCVVYYAMASATSGAVYWQAALEAVTPGDSLDLDASTSFDTANSGNGTVPGTAGYMQSISITMTNKDSIAAGDLCWLKLNRDADHASDTATGDALVYRVELRSA